MNIWETLPRPFFVLAPMYDVTDTVFRRVIAECAPPDLYVTEFVSVDGLQSAGRESLLKYLQFTDEERPLIAQIWGKDPENYFKTARQIADGSLVDEIAWLRTKHGDAVQETGEARNEPYKRYGEVSTGARATAMRPKHSRLASSAGQQSSAMLSFAGVDINMGCPDKTIVKNGCCAALINNRELAAEIIQAVTEGAPSLPISVKTRLGLSEVDLTWHEFLLKLKLNALTIHGRTAKQMSKVPADWDKIAAVRELRDKLSPDTIIIGNGDVMTRDQGQELVKKYRVDGIMIGRGVFNDPFAFADSSPWETYTKEQRIALYRRHVELFIDTYRHDERKVHGLYKFCKIYINGFDGAKELRERLMSAGSAQELLTRLNSR